MNEKKNKKRVFYAGYNLKLNGEVVNSPTQAVLTLNFNLNPIFESPICFYHFFDEEHCYQFIF